MTLRYGSVCSGIEAATVAWHPLGWQPQFFSEIDAAPRAVLTHRYPEVPLHGDFTTIREGRYGAIDLLVGGTPCQSFSVAGLRGGLADDRGNLALEYLRLAQRLRPRWLVWENVPGVLSSNGGRDFGAILGGMVELGFGVAYRVLDAQFIRVDGFGRAVPQRRRRVFVVGYLGDWRRAAAVLLERACLRGDPAPRREAGAGAARAAAPGAGARGGDAGWPPTGRPATQAFGGGQNCNPTDVSTALSAHPGGRYDLDLETFVAQAVAGALGTSGRDSGYRIGAEEAAGNMIVPVASTLVSGGHSNNPLDENLIAFQQAGSNIGTTGPVTNTLLAGNGNESGGVPCIAFDCKAGGDTGFAIGDVAGALRGEGHGGGHAAAMVGHNGGPPLSGWAVRRLTPEECEALQGFPRGHTAVPWRKGNMPDGPRYKMCGNSMAVNAMRWIGRRIVMVESIPAPDLPLFAAE